MILEARHRYIGAYVLGYSAEMFLKCSVFRHRGMKSEGTIRDCFSDIERYHKRNVIGEIPPHENFHSLRYWTHLLLAIRTRDDRMLAKSSEAQLLYHSDSIYANW